MYNYYNEKKQTNEKETRTLSVVGLDDHGVKLPLDMKRKIGVESVDNVVRH